MVESIAMENCMRWLVTNRNLADDGFGQDQAELTYWTLRAPDLPVDVKSSWQQQSLDDFLNLLKTAAASFPDPRLAPSNAPRHICLFVHGYNESWQDAALLYEKVASGIFDGFDGLGELISFDWPSAGSVLGYLPDRCAARQTADDLTELLENLYDHQLQMQKITAADPTQACRAQTSAIAHSMGNYALAYALYQLWTRKNRPLLVSLLQQVLMVAADVDNDLFSSGESISNDCGEGLANLCYRITALYTGRDAVLGASAGLKHFGKRRLGRAGLDRSQPLPDNVWDVDCSNLLDPNVDGLQIHCEYFESGEKRCYNLMRALLSGEDRTLLLRSGLAPAALAKI
ncbi:alpha/beta hydrolase [Telmatobacter bradus]|uniref:alpha/beta hydrolase n=1 Tax=Telmatobacter bradus TaxID=474953 RepID=UPI003B42BA88